MEAKALHTQMPNIKPEHQLDYAPGSLLELDVEYGIESPWSKVIIGVMAKSGFLGKVRKEGGVTLIHYPTYVDRVLFFKKVCEMEREEGNDGIELFTVIVSVT